jgi:betaine-aldehyde dehydrogenase
LLGGKSPSIVFPDANEDWVVDGIIAAMRFTRQSQSCTAGSRLFLHADIFDKFLDRLKEKTAALKIGDPLEEATDIGAIINERQFKKVCSYVEDGLHQPAARLVIGGLPPETGPLSEGYFASPTAFANVANDWRPAREEIFGPVLVAIPWTDEAAAIRMANDSHYGLAAYGWTHDIGRALRTAHAIEAGWVQVNRTIAGPLLWRLQTERHRPRILARRDARQLHAEEERHRQPQRLSAQPLTPTLSPQAGRGRV